MRSSSPQASIVSLYIGHLRTLSSLVGQYYPSLSLSLSLSQKNTTPPLFLCKLGLIFITKTILQTIRKYKLAKPYKQFLSYQIVDF